MAFSCTPAQLLEVVDYVKDSSVAELICKQYDVAADLTSAVLHYAVEAAALSRGVHGVARALDEEAPLTLEDVNASVQDAIVGTNYSYLLFSAYLVFAMQTGFAMVCAGNVRSKNVTNILLKNVLDSCVGAIMWYCLGYGFAFGFDPKTEGHKSNQFIGNSDFALTDTQVSGRWDSFLFQWAFSAAAATIVSGSVAERTTIIGYLGYASFIVAFVYPVGVHWLWSSTGWLTAFRSDPLLDSGAIDFAGSGVVHMCGGVAAFWGAFIVGPRIGRFDADGKPTDMRGNNTALTVLGTFILWFGWYGFNPGSQLAITGTVNAVIVARTAVTTTLAPSAAGCSAMFIKYILTHTWDITTTTNGVLGGLVAVTAPCSIIHPWSAIILGLIAGAVVTFGEYLLLKVKVDDVVGAVPVHFFCGATGVLWVGCMAQEDFLFDVYGSYGPFGEKGNRRMGIFYGGNGNLLLCQFIEVLSIFSWVSATMGLYFFLAKKAGILRVPAQVELAGLDVSKHGGSAYHYDLPIPVTK